MSEFALFALIFLAIAIGWLLGRHGPGRKEGRQPPGSELNRQYVTGFNFLLNDQPDGAIDAFIASLEVNSETIETHLAIGSLSRRRGETERAIRVHQNLLARLTLSPEQRQTVQYELALDYMKAGWLDRAERILVDLLAQPAQQRVPILRTLIDIYQQEQEWAQAIDHASELLHLLTPREAQKLGRSAAHFCCEQAELEIARQRYAAASKALRRGSRFDPDSLRVGIMRARVLLLNEQPKKALAEVRKLADRDPANLAEVLDESRQAFQQLDNERGLLKLLRAYLSDDSPSALVMAVHGELLRLEGPSEAAAFLHGRLSQKSSMSALARILEHDMLEIEGQARDTVQRISALLNAELAARHKFRCRQCGFSGQQRHWRCPSCKSWGSVERITPASKQEEIA